MSDQSPSSIVYEYPFNERVRTFLRLEQLFNQCIHFLQGNSHWDSRTAMQSLIDILTTLERVDIKSELIKELERYAASLAPLRRLDGIDTAKLDEILNRNNSLIQKLHTSEGKIGHELRDNELFNTARQKSSIPGGPNAYDTPGYFFWLQQSLAFRHQRLTEWLRSFEPIFSAITMVLALIRESAQSNIVEAIDGRYEQALNSQSPFQLARVVLPADTLAFPEISGSKYQIHVRLLTMSEDLSTTAYTESISFELTLCQL